MQKTREDLANLQPHYPDMINEVIDLTDHSRNMIFNMTLEEATERVSSGDIDSIREIEGHFAIMARHNHIIRMARSLQFPMRYFIVKKVAGPALLLAERIDQIKEWLEAQGFWRPIPPIVYTYGPRSPPYRNCTCRLPRSKSCLHTFLQPSIVMCAETNYAETIHYQNFQQWAFPNGSIVFQYMNQSA